MESLVCTIHELEAGVATPFNVQGTDILLYNTKDGVFATGAKCSHYGAPLAKGVVSGDRVTCPWHGACFNIKNGDIEESPAIKGISSFSVRMEGDRIYVSVPEQCASSPTKTAAVVPESTSEHVVVIGGGAAGSAAVETLVSGGFAGKVTLLSEEDELPYDRPKLSKDLGASNIELRSREFYQGLGVQLRLGEKVKELFHSEKYLNLESGEKISYDHVIVCSGATPFNIPVPGHDAENVFLLRSKSDAAKIEQACACAKSVVIIGTGFIGLEAATYFKKNKEIANVSAVSADTVPLERVFGTRIGKVFEKMHKDNGVDLHLSSSLSHYKLSEEGKVSHVVLEDGTELACDFVLVGAGVRVNTGFIKGIELNSRDKSIQVDEYMRHSSGLYAAGDIVCFPYLQDEGRLFRIEHWNVAQKQGRIAALNVLGKQSKYESIPYFWTVQFGGSIRYVGHSEDHDDVLVLGTPEEDQKFAAFYTRGETVLAVATLGRDPVASASAELMRIGKMPSAKQLRDGTDVVELLKSLQ